MLYEGPPDDPTAERFWQMIEHRVTTFGISPTAIRLLMRKAGSGPDGFDRGLLRLLGSTGEPWDEISYRWFFECVGRGRRPILNISGGTEIIGCFLARWADHRRAWPRTFSTRRTGPCEASWATWLCTKPAPSMTRGVWNHPQRGCGRLLVSRRAGRRVVQRGWAQSGSGRGGGVLDRAYRRKSAGVRGAETGGRANRRVNRCQRRVGGARGAVDGAHLPAARHPRGPGVAQDPKREGGAAVDPPGSSAKAWGISRQWRIPRRWSASKLEKVAFVTVLGLRTLSN